MIESTSDADEQHVEVRNLPCCVVSVLSAVPDALDCEIHEEDVGQGVDDLGDEYCSVVVLSSSPFSFSSVESQQSDDVRHLPLHTSLRSL